MWGRIEEEQKTHYARSKGIPTWAGEELSEIRGSFVAIVLIKSDQTPDFQSSVSIIIYIYHICIYIFPPMHLLISTADNESLLTFIISWDKSFTWLMADLCQGIKEALDLLSRWIYICYSYHFGSCTNVLMKQFLLRNVPSKHLINKEISWLRSAI